MVPPWAVLHEMTADIGYLHPSSVRSPPLTLTSGTALASFETSHSAQSHFFPPFRKGGSSELSLLNPHMLISISEATSQKLSPRLFLAGQRGLGSFPRLFTFVDDRQKSFQRCLKYPVWEEWEVGHMSGWQFMSVAGRDGSQCAPASSEAKRTHLGARLPESEFCSTICSPCDLRQVN